MREKLYPLVNSGPQAVSRHGCTGFNVLYEENAYHNEPPLAAAASVLQIPAGASFSPLIHYHNFVDYLASLTGAQVAIKKSHAHHRAAIVKYANRDTVFVEKTEFH